MLKEVDVLKISDVELEFLTKTTNLEEGVDSLQKYDIPLIIVTLGAEGSILFTKSEPVQVPAIKVKAVDTTGAGDAYVFGIFYCLDQYEGDIRSISVERLEYNMARFASVSGGLAAYVKGAMSALPSFKQVEENLAEN